MRVGHNRILIKDNQDIIVFNYKGTQLCKIPYSYSYTILPGGLIFAPDKLYDSTGTNLMAEEKNISNLTYAVSDLFIFNNNSGIINSKGNEIVPSRTGEIAYLNDGFFTYTPQYQTGICDQWGKEIIPPVYEEISYIQDGIFRVLENNKIGYIRNNMKWILEPQK